MVLHKRLDYGFYGYQVPPAPRGIRSARRRRSFWKNFDDNKICSFNLLTSVAQKLLLEREGCPSSTNSFSGKEHTVVIKDSVKKEQLDVDNTVTINTCINETRGNIFLSEIISQPPVLDHGSQEFLQDCLEKAGSPEKVINGEKHIERGCFSKKVEVCSDCWLEKEGEKQIKAEPQSIGKVSNCWFDMSSSEGPVVWDPEPSAPVSSTNNLKLPFCTDHIPPGSYPVYTNGVKLVFRDDDENSRCIQPTTAIKAYRPLLRNGNRRIRKLVVSKYWKVTPKLKNEEHFSADAEVTHAFLNRKNGYKRLRSQKDYPFKKRKFYDHISLSNSGGRIGSDNISGSPGNDFKEDASGLGGKVHEATRTSASGAVQHSMKQSGDSHVKLKIKSFKVPEFFIEIPESATVGLLKRSVMEAVTTILGGEPRVGILLQGKKIGDDEKTLLQTGISHDNQLDSLGFALEPDSFQVPQPLFREGPQFLFRPQPITRCPPAPSIVHDIGQQGISDTSHDPPIMNSGNFVESDHDSVPSPPDIPIHRGATDSRALVAVPAMNAEAPSAVSLQKSKRAEAAQRRIRRPFSVAEVEALVEAVEKLGTGRWRDVKMHAFDNAKHRTYVDLKDKWKTLVHTARIFPQQRRGEPVPQELLDRVLTAHAYWSQQQAKHQLRQQEPALSRLL